MEFKVYQKELELQSRGWIPTFHDVSREVVEIVKESGIKNGTVCIASHHTTCSVMIQECSHDIDSFDLEYLQHDLLDIMRKMIPDFAEEHQYRHPGPIHTQFGRYVNEPGDYTSMNTDGHLRSVFFGRSETMTIKDGVLDGGEFAHIYFIPGDQRGDEPVLVFQDPALAQPLDDGVGRRPLPAQLLLTKLRQLRCGDRLVLP